MLHLLLLPLRVPVEDVDWQQRLTEWLQDAPSLYSNDASFSQKSGDTQQPNQQPNQQRPIPVFTPMECVEDLKRLSDLRRRVQEALRGGYETALEALPDFTEYAAVLEEFEKAGFPTTDTMGATHLEIRWRNQPPPTANASTASQGLPLTDRAAAAYFESMESHASLSFERANVLWNLVVLTVYQATRLEPLTTRDGWQKARLSLQNAANLTAHLTTVCRTHSFASETLSESFLQRYESFLLAQGQHAGYERLGLLGRNPRDLSTKVAAAMVPLLETVVEQCQTYPHSHAAVEPLIRSWREAARAWSLWAKAVTEYHQSLVHEQALSRLKKAAGASSSSSSSSSEDCGLEVARLQAAQHWIGACLEQLEQLGSSSVNDDDNQQQEHLRTKVLALSELVEERLQVAQELNETQYRQRVPAMDQLPVIARQQVVSMDPHAISKLLPPLVTPLFQHVLLEPARKYVSYFHTEMERMVVETEQVSEERTEHARRTLAEVNLPHSLTAHRQELNGGGIPDELWRRVEQVQGERKDVRLRQELWELRELAESARSTHKMIESRLEEDLQGDRRFRQDYPHFEGHDVNEIQRTFRHTLQNFDRLMVAAQESDALLLRRCEILDSDKKFNLIKLERSQLDRLLPQRGGGGGAQGIDISLLSQYLIDLSGLFNDRENLLVRLRDDAKAFNIATKLLQVDKQPSAASLSSNALEQLYQQTADDAIDSFGPMIHKMKENLDEQTELLKRIVRENQVFMRARQVSHTSSDSVIVQIEDALEELEQFSKHLREGRVFYDVMIPKLERLKQQVGDVNARLTQERYQYQDDILQQQQREQEQRDRQMATTLNQPQYPRGPPGLPRATRPGVREVINGVEVQPVDNEKVAQLMEFGFETTAIVAALRRCDNNLDRALEDLLNS